ncbi:MAG: hypothetical protein WD972_01525 [Candidatus Andersenbacteria bacterium]
MLSSLWSLFSVITVTLAAPLTGPTERVELPLPQDVQYSQYIAAQLHNASFSTDTGSVAAETTGPKLQAFIANTKVCVAANDTSAYRILVRNVGDIPAHDVGVEFRHPPGIEAVNIVPIPESEEDGRIVWVIPLLGPQQSAEFQVVLRIDADINKLVTQLSVAGEGGRVFTEHTIDGICGQYTGPTSTLPAGKLPVIICHPAEQGCLPTAQSLELGPNFQRAQGVTVCSPNDPEGCVAQEPRLGKRFAEAIADIIPGECRVVEDNIIATPEFHDALNRQGKPAAPFMLPLYNSGQDFVRLVHENVLLGIPNSFHARDVLRRLNLKHTEKQKGPIQKVLNGQLASTEVRTKIQPWMQEWRDETITAQRDLKQRYIQLQVQRQPKIDPLLPKAITNARTSIEQSCGQPDDGGLSSRLPAVKTAYQRNLVSRAQAYDQTQQNFVQLTGPLANFNLAQWQVDLASALDAFDQGNPTLLKKYLDTLPERERHAFTTGFENTYAKHATDDEAADNRLRLNQWERALDEPKTRAANCEKELRFGARIETTWCESGINPELHIDRPRPVRTDVAPPVAIPGGENAQIDERLVSGQAAPPACRGLPGDPWWAADCSCNCGAIIPNLKDPNNPNLGFCQFGGERKRITRHDKFIQTQQECLADDGDRDNHQDPFF